MSKFIAKIKNFIRQEEGPSMVEYGLLIGLIAVVVAFSSEILGKELKDIFEDVAKMFGDD